MEGGRLRHAAVLVGLGRTFGTAQRVGQRKRAHCEDVVAGIALQAQHGLVGVDGELVVAGAALRQQGRTVAPGEPAARRRQRAEHVVGVDVGRRVALGAVELSDLEAVVAEAAVERGDRAVVVGGEAVVAALAVDLEPAVDGRVVVDALNRGRQARLGVRHAAVQHADKGRSVGRFVAAEAGNRVRATQQEDVVGGVRQILVRRVGAVQCRVGTVD